MNATEVKGLVIRTVDIKESDRMITVFTEELGVVSAMAHGARSLRSRQMASTQQFCYGSFVLAQKGELYYIKEASLIESFFDIRKTLDGLALASYICEVLAYVTVEEAERDLLRLALNALYAIAAGKHPADKIKAAFEVRAAAVLGFMPDVVACRDCKKKNGDFILDVMGGDVQCVACRDEKRRLSDLLPDDGHEAHVICLLPAGAKMAFTYCVYCPLEKLLSFDISDDGDRNLFYKAAETYLIHHLERSFGTLDFYHGVKK